ncbi:hypothetical protein L6E12_30095 [Actinokineospora sp. PR83]|uniref:hypothetical protein n=1 Tax=Actinokineospora sp. PR83 TaxID=2884908 RepID=UPI001F37C104|nr:hypothetical protein [Actinokineospora sp. PR83]MCG8920031.1 hypothetical protein [Actinokineospora sp. PR83]
MTGPLDPIGQAELLREASGSLLSVAPTGWRELQFTFHSTISVDTAMLLCATGDGEPVPLAPPMKALRLFAKLRGGMYTTGKGAWFTARMIVSSSGSHEVTYDYDSEPEFTPPLVPETFVEDFRHFPRAEENTPAWLRQKFAEAGRSSS